MDSNFAQAFLAIFLTAALICAPACSAPPEITETNDIEKNPGDEIAAVLDNIPDGKLTRFILTISADADGKIGRRQVDAVLDSLQKTGAKAEWLEGSPVIFVTCDKAAIYEALESGYISTVQVDQLRKPMD